MKSISALYEDVKFYPTQNAGRLAYVEIGEGKQTLLFLHGMGSNLKAWYKNILTLKNHYRCIAIDLPGFGQSDRLAEAFTIERAREVVIAFIRSKGFERVSLVGHSMGGQISIAAAHAAPELITSLILCAPAGIEVFTESEIELITKFFTADLLTTYSAKMIERNYHLNFHKMPEDAFFMIAERQALMKEAEAYLSFCEVVAESTKSIISNNVLELLGDLENRVMILYGKEDKLIPHHIVHPEKTIYGIAEAAEKQIKNGELKIYDNCGHFLQWEENEKFCSDLIAFLNNRA